MGKLFYLVTLILFSQFSFAQCDLEIKYDDAGNRIFRGNACNPDCSTHVVNTKDIGQGSLREAIYCAMDGDNITFESALANQTIKIAHGKLLIDKSIEINKTTVDYTPVNIKVRSNIDDVVLEIAPSYSVWVNNMDLISNNGFNNNPRVLDNKGTLTLQNIDLVDDGAFAEENSTLLNTGTLTILEFVNLIYAFYQ